MREKPIKINTMTRLLVALILTISLMVVLAEQSRADSTASDPVFESLEIRTVSGDRHTFRVEVARTQEEWGRGLMFRYHLDDDAGMLFDLGQMRPISMWMKNTYIELDMLFLDETGTIVHIEHRAEPHSTTSRSPGQPVKGILELNGGVAETLGISVGDQIIHSSFAP